MEKEPLRGTYEHCKTLSDGELASLCDQLSGARFINSMGEHVLSNVCKVLCERGFLIFNASIGQYEKSKDKAWPVK